MEGIVCGEEGRGELLETTLTTQAKDFSLNLYSNSVLLCVHGDTLSLSLCLMHPSVSVFANFKNIYIKKEGTYKFIEYIHPLTPPPPPHPLVINNNNKNH